LGDLTVFSVILGVVAHAQKQLLISF